jgi:hypothetical protein
MNQEMKDWIDNASYRDLLSRWRHHDVGSPWFQGEIGHYYSKVMSRKRSEISTDEQVAASKSIGW